MNEKITAPRRQPMQKRARAKREAILAAARQLIEKQGLEAVTCIRVADMAQVPVGSVYSYFPNNVAIIEALADTWLTDLREQFSAVEQRNLQAESWHVVFAELLEIVYGDPANPEGRPLAMALTKALDFYPELQQLRRHHGNSMSQILANLLKAAGSPWPADRLQRLARFGYELIGGLDNYLALEDVDRSEALAWIYQSLTPLIADCLTPKQGD